MNPHIAHDRNLDAPYQRAHADTDRFDKRADALATDLFNTMCNDLKSGVVVNCTKDVVAGLVDQMTDKSMALAIGHLMSGLNDEFAAEVKKLLCKAILIKAEADAITDTENWDPL